MGLGSKRRVYLHGRIEVTRKQRAFIKYVQRIRPKTVADLRPRYHPRFLRQGAYRQTFTVLGLVIKFPGHSNPRAYCLDHAVCEARAVRFMRRDPMMKALRRYAPTILHFDRGRGVTIMPRYKPVKPSQSFRGFRDTFECMLDDLVPTRWGFDGQVANFGLDENDCYVVLDTGLIGDIVS